MKAEIKMMSENVLHLGLCLPKSCSNRQVHDLVQKYFSSTDLQQEFGLQAKVLQVKVLQFNPQFFLQKSFLIFIACLIFVKFLNRSSKKLEMSIKFDENNYIALGTEGQIKLSSYQKLVKCFNYEQNLSVLRSREAPKSSVNSISGLRFERKT